MIGTCLRTIACLLLLCLAAPADAEPLIGDLLDAVTPSEIVPDATSFGEMTEDGLVPATAGDDVLGWAFLTSDFVPTTGYSGKPIHIVAGISPDAVLTGAKLVKHSEPIVLVGIPESEIVKVIQHYTGFDLHDVSGPRAAGDLEIVSGATVTIMVIDDSILRAGVAVARTLGLPGFAAEQAGGPEREIDREAGAVTDWQTLAGNGALRQISLDVAEINADFAALGDPRTEKNAEPGPDTDPVVAVWTALVSQPAIGRSLLGDAAYANLEKRLDPGDEAIAVFGAGRWSFKGSGYVRGGIFDRFHLIQEEASFRFRDRNHTRIVRVAADGAPAFSEMDLFIVPAEAGFDPAKPFRLQFLVSRAVGPIEKTFLTYDLGYELPDVYTRTVAPAAAPETIAAATDSQARDALWKRIWQTKRIEVVVLAAALGLLTIIFFFQSFATKNARTFDILRTAYLVFTLVFIGWIANAQLSVVNVLAVANAVFSDFHWETFLMDPLIFILWFAVAAALLFWARGAYCGWLCPFGALQELTNKIARAFRVPQITLPWGLHERLWAVKYMLFLGLFGVSLYSFELAEHLAEIEPFKTAIILKFARPLPYVLIALACLLPGLFIERFYCRYVCPLGGGLAIPARLHMFQWLKRYKECGNPCQLCATDCPVDAIHPTGEINPNECISCLNCQVLYQDHARCPVVIKVDKRRAQAAASAASLAAHSERPNVGHPNQIARENKRRESND
ncbi:NosR/NirI family protein [Tropicimonas isoalkanivorans]|uniref:NosR/NirI family transcriptional regulator, nitrous oxide reductase regulator n=1 Tax=Tropicimonas isoalkanivorans TaxID=441112 RepID=A0A1I1HMJ5_9RHOB|nr:NosR/NirI family protein [Tropicimonas isoalkanivorans]SFC25307.1 NosR/NirI family transcriptional regulator, nitrous oxide reductase regulator [Tropicimonas isoalkanivorans]